MLYYDADADDDDYENLMFEIKNLVRFRINDNKNHPEKLTCISD